ncbi:MAG: HD domain-containing protein [Acidobacteria bacterium]|nr:HD domain-containing protein [Acidobacteriota bacterium]
MSTVKLSTVLSAMSYALDLTEGQPQGHASRSCLIGMRVAEELRLAADERSDLFYALLMKDAGCSSNAARVSQLFGGNDQDAKRSLWERDWRRWREKIAYALEYTEPDGSLLQRMRRFAALAKAGPSSQRELFEIRCDRGANIARALGVSEPTAIAIRCMDEHWDGGGYPEGLRRDEIPLYARIIGLAQVTEIYWGRGGPDAALEVARERRSRWFDPELVKVLLAMGTSDRLWSLLRSHAPQEAIAAAEPIERAIPADESRLDRIAHAFALVVDAKSTFTYHHSDRVAAISDQIAAEMGIAGGHRVRLRRAALLHDIGKLSVPNRILDKPGKLDAAEWEVVKRHPYFTYEILARVPVFSEFAYDASCHHERIDGRGYHRGVPGDALSPQARIMATADIFDALSAARPYRGAMPLDQVLGIIQQGRGTQLCPNTIDALTAVAAKNSAALTASA